MTKTGRPPKYKLQIIHHLACHNEPHERTLRAMTDRIAGRTKGISSLQRQITALSRERLIAPHKETIAIGSRPGRACERTVIVYNLEPQKWLDIFSLFFSDDKCYVESDWREWEKASSSSIASASFRRQRRQELLASEYARNTNDKNFSDLVSRVLLRWLELLSRQYGRDLFSGQSHSDFDSAWKTYGQRQRTLVLSLMGLSGMKRSGHFHRKTLQIPSVAVMESDKDFKILATLVRFSPSLVDYMLRQDPGNEVVPSFIVNLRRFVDDCVEQKMTPSMISRKAVRELGDSVKRVLVMMVVHDVTAMPSDLLDRLYSDSDKEALRWLSTHEKLAVILQPSSDYEK